MEIVQTCTGTLRQCVGMFGATAVVVALFFVLEQRLVFLLGVAHQRGQRRFKMFFSGRRNGLR